MSIHHLKINLAFTALKEEEVKFQLQMLKYSSTELQMWSFHVAMEIAQ